MYYPPFEEIISYLPRLCTNLPGFKGCTSVDCKVCPYFIATDAYQSVCRLTYLFKQENATYVFQRLPEIQKHYDLTPERYPHLFV